MPSFHDHGTSCSGEKDFKGFYHIWALGHLGQVLVKKMFENNGHIHVYSPKTGADNPLGSMFFFFI